MGEQQEVAPKDRTVGGRFHSQRNGDVTADAPPMRFVHRSHGIGVLQFSTKVRIPIRFFVAPGTGYVRTHARTYLSPSVIL